ncbi:nuclear transport factor 2 family protein [Massilia sp. CT11-137]|uniref:nuclear transport factor 2 family protein n=1 Tax=Massilia sp. CT11-137 TaxID=3393901 RepID=UPI0039A6436D
MDDQRAIAAVLGDYFKGLYTGDTALLRTVFHPDAALFAERSGQPYHKRLDDYLDGVAARASPAALGEAYRMRVLAIDVTHDIAMARVHVPALGFDYVNYLSFVRREGRWAIVNKVFTEVPVSG